MFVTFDTEARATYVEVSPAQVAATIEVSDSVMVDVAVDGQPVGVEFLMMPEKISDAHIARVVHRFPMLEKLNHLDDWLRMPA